MGRYGFCGEERFHHCSTNEMCEDLGKLEKILQKLTLYVGIFPIYGISVSLCLQNWKFFFVKKRRFHLTKLISPTLDCYSFNFSISFFFPKSPLQKAFFLSEALMGFCLIFLRSSGDMQIK